MPDRPLETPEGIEIPLVEDPWEKFANPSQEEKDSFRAIAVDISSRGMVNAALEVALPEGIEGQWVANDPKEIARLKTLGFVEDTEFALKNALHNDGSGRAVIGDTIHMLIPKWKKEIINAERDKKFFAKHGFKGGGHLMQEERDFLANDRSIIGTFSDSNAKTTTIVKET
jgi:hypothetical protein